VILLGKTLIAVCLVTVMLLFGCTLGSKPAGNNSGSRAASSSAAGGSTSLELAGQQLNLAGVQNAKIIGVGDTVTVSYDPSDADYEGRILADWGAIFGVLEKDYPSATRYKIVQLLGGEQVATVSVNASDVRDLGKGRISITQFNKRIVLGGSRS